MDYRLALMCGNDTLPVPECQIVVHQPRIHELALIGEDDFFMGAQCLCLNKSMFVEDKNVLSNTNNFQIFMMVMQEKEAADKKLATQQVCSLLFPNYQTVFTPNSMLLMNNEGSIIIDENNFEALQEVLRKVFCVKDNPSVSYNPGNDKAREIAKKIMRGKERIAAEKRASDSSVLSQYLSTLAVGLHYPMSELINLTLFQLYDLIERYSLWTSWDIDIRSRLAGGKSDGQPENWMKNIH